MAGIVGSPFYFVTYEFVKSLFKVRLLLCFVVTSKLFELMLLLLLLAALHFFFLSPHFYPTLNGALVGHWTSLASKGGR